MNAVRVHMQCFSTSNENSKKITQTLLISDKNCTETNNTNGHVPITYNKYNN